MTKHYWLLVLLFFGFGNSHAQTIYGGTMFRSIVIPPFGTAADPNAYSLLVHFYVGQNDVSKMPNDLQIYLYKSADKSLVKTFKVKIEATSLGAFGNPCNPDTILYINNVNYLGIIDLPPSIYTDPAGYFFVNEPIGNRPVTKNGQSDKIVLYHWFSPAFLFGQPDGSGPGKTSTFMLGNPILRCQKTNHSTQFNAFAYDKAVNSILGPASPPSILDINIRLANPLQNAPNGILQEINWKPGYSTTNPLPGSPWATALTKGPANGEAMLTVTPDQPVTDGWYTVAAIVEQRNNGVKVSESLTEHTLIYTTCPKIAPPTITYNRPGETPSATIPKLCPGDLLVVNANNQKPNQLYAWFKDTKVITGQTSSTITLSEPGNYRVRIMQAGVCDSASVQINIPASVTPTVSIISNVSATTSTSCVATGAVTLSATASPTGSSFTWYNGQSRYTIPANSPELTTNVNGIYTVVITSPEGCTARSNAIPLTFSGPPTATILPPISTTFCPGNTGELTTQPIADHQYEWFRDGQTTGVTTDFIRSIAAGTYTVKVTGPGGCTALSAPITLTSPQAPIPTIVSDTKLCLGSSLIMQVAPATATRYQWFRDGQAESNATSPTYSISLAGNYTVRVTYASGCTAVSPVQIILQESSIPVTMTPIPALCGLSSVPINLTASPSGGTFSGQGVLNNQFISQVAGTGSFTITYTPPANISGCVSGNATQTIVVRPGPSLNLPPVLETGSGIPTLLPGDIGAGYQYQWTPPLYLDNPTIGNATSTPSAPITYSLTVTDNFGCSASDTVRVDLVLGFYVPSAFTPNNDGMNDTWVLTGINDFPQIEVSIFNRWGEVVFYSKGYVQPFDGRYIGEQLSTGTYTYLIRLRPTENPKRGTVTLIR